MPRVELDPDAPSMTHDDGSADLSSRVERERAHYERASKSFTAMRRWVSRAVGEFDRSDEIRACFDPLGKDVLDYGCGLGYLSMELLARGARHVTGIDVSERQIGIAARRATERGFADRSAFLVADAHRTGLPDDAFDLVV